MQSKRFLSLTKDDYKRFRECYKLFWIYKNREALVAFQQLQSERKIQIQQKKAFVDVIENNSFTLSAFVDDQTIKQYVANNDQQYIKLAQLDPSKVADGKTVGDYAKDYYYDQDQYVCYDFSQLKTRSYTTTKPVLQNKHYNVFFEPTFQYEQMTMRADVLIRDQHDPDAFHLVEVKAKTCFQKDLKNGGFKTKAIPRELLYDVAYQYFICHQLGIKIISVGLLLLDNRIVHESEVQLDNLFVLLRDYREESLLTYCQNEFTITRFLLEQLFFAYEQDLAHLQLDHNHHENVFVRLNCHNHNNLWQFCPHITAYISDQDNIYYLYRGIRLANALYYEHKVKYLTTVRPQKTYCVNGKVKSLSDQQQRQVIVTQTNNYLVDPSHRAELLQMLAFYKEHFPLYMYDFEAAKTAIPLFKHMKVYQDIPFQYSVHVLTSWNDLAKADEDLIHHGYLHNDKNELDPRLAVIEHLTHDLFMKGEGYYVAYYQSYEKRMLNSLITYLDFLHEDLTLQHNWDQYALWKQQLLYIHDHHLDLMDFFTKFKIYHPLFQGKTSIKKTLPAFCPAFTYSNLTIQNGLVASEAYRFKMTKDIKEPFWEEHVYPALWKYCSQDSLAMVKLFQKIVYLLEGE